MTCPYCNAELEKGYIKSSHPMRWGTTRESGFATDDLVLAKLSLKGAFEGLFVDAHCCKKCKKIIVSFE